MNNKITLSRITFLFAQIREINHANWFDLDYSFSRFIRNIFNLKRSIRFIGNRKICVLKFERFETSQVFGISGEKFRAGIVGSKRAKINVCTDRAWKGRNAASVQTSYV